MTTEMKAQAAFRIISRLEADNRRLTEEVARLTKVVTPLVAMFSPHAHCGCAACNARAAIAKAEGADQ